MEFLFWYDVASYCNTAFKGNFSEREVAENAYELKCEWDWSIQHGKVGYGIIGLLAELRMDNTDEVDQFIEAIESEIEYKGLRREA